MSTKPTNLHEAVYQALGAASVCWVGGTGDLVFDSTQAAIVGADLIEWIEEWHRSEQPSYLPSGMDEFAAPQARLGSGFVETLGWDREEGERTIADLQARLDAAQAEVRALLHIRSVLETEITALRETGPQP